MLLMQEETALRSDFRYVCFGATPLVSGNTGRTIFVNYGRDQFAILQSFDPVALVAVRADWESHQAELRRPTHKPAAAKRLKVGQFTITSRVRSVIASCLGASSEDEFALFLDQLITAGVTKIDEAGGSKRVFEVLILLWRHGLIAFPAGWVWNSPLAEFPETSQFLFGPMGAAISEMMNDTEGYRRVYTGAMDKKGTRNMRLLILACGRATAIGDIDGTVLEGFGRFLPPRPKGRNMIVCDMLRAMQVVAYSSDPEMLKRIPSSYRAALRAPSLRVVLDNKDVAEDGLSFVCFEASPITSAITGRTIYVNYDFTRYAVLPDFRLGCLSAARNDWESESCSRHGKTKNASAITLECINTVFRARNPEEFARALQQLIARRSLKVRQYRSGEIFDGAPSLKSGDATRISEALLLLWKHDLLAFPAGEIWGETTVRFATMGELTEEFYGPLASTIRTLDGSVRWGTVQRRVPRMVFLACGGIREIGDIDSIVLQGFIPFAMDKTGNRKFPRSVNILCDQLRALQLQSYAGEVRKLSAIPQSYRTVFRPIVLGRNDPEFSWAGNLGQRVESWRSHVASYVASLPNRVTRRVEITTFNALLDYVHANTDVPDAPLDYCRRDCKPGLSFDAFFSRNRSAFHSDNTVKRVGLFLEWLLEKEVMDEDGYIPRDYYNPHLPSDIAGHSYNRGQTHRTAIPIRYLRMLQEIIEEDDFAWPRTLRQDYFEWMNPETGQLENVWSPVRAYAYLVRLHVPLRGFQVRLLDSGEGDPEIFRPDQGGWIPNDGPWKPSNGGGAKYPSSGFVRSIWDHQTGRYFNGLYVTTNKTADHVKGFVECGYEIPWEHPQLITLFLDLRDWQEKYNPSLRPMTRSELRDKSLSASEDVAVRLQKHHFLFRDPASGDGPLEPVSSGRLQGFWYRLIAELERRLAERGVTNSDGSHIRLVTKYVGEAPAGTIFDPHSLRVAGLTAFAAAGVPFHILSEFIAGHAGELATIYYCKPGASEISLALDEATMNMIEIEQRQWTAFLKDRPIELLQDVAILNSPAGAQAAAKIQTGLWSPMDEGTCPNGGTMCAIGGPLIDSRRKIYAGVIGGHRNCVLCRFFVTGPAYLAGLVERFNATAGLIFEAILRVHALSTKRRELVKMQLAAEKEGRQFGQHRQIARAEEELVKAEGDVDIAAQTWVGQWTLIQRCQALLHKRMRERQEEDTPNALVLNGRLGDLRVALESCSEFDLWDRICSSSEFFEGVDARLPSLRRGRLYDAMLAREGRPALFATLSDAEIVAVGNEATKLLREQVGRSSLNQLIDGQATLKSLGLEELVDQFVTHAPEARRIEPLPQPRHSMPVTPVEPGLLPAS